MELYTNLNPPYICMVCWIGTSPLRSRNNRSSRFSFNQPTQSWSISIHSFHLISETPRHRCSIKWKMILHKVCELLSAWLISDDGFCGNVMTHSTWCSACNVSWSICCSRTQRGFANFDNLVVCLTIWSLEFIYMVNRFKIQFRARRKFTESPLQRPLNSVSWNNSGPSGY